jgi:drug/metabolite transporter (DMT)-like permease
MTNTWVVVGLSLGAGFGFAVSTNLKHASAADLPVLPRLSVRNISRFLAVMTLHRLWLLGVVADVAGLVMQIFALHLGALAIVQPLLVSGLLFSVLLRQLKTPNPRRTDLVWSGVLVASLAGFLLVVGSGSGVNPSQAADHLPAALAALVGATVAVGAVWLARRHGPAAISATLIGAAVGLLYAADAALLKGVTNEAVRGVGDLLRGWQLYTVIVVGGLGLFLSQLAYQAGPLTASQPTIAAVDPLASVAIGVLIFDEHLRRGPWAGAALPVLIVLLVLSVLKLGRRPAPT